MRSVLAPLLLAWLMVHAALLGIFLVLKFLGAKMLFAVLLLATALWLLTRRQQPKLLSPSSII
jgi:hypothetical protein